MSLNKMELKARLYELGVIDYDQEATNAVLQELVDKAEKVENTKIEEVRAELDKAGIYHDGSETLSELQAVLADPTLAKSKPEQPSTSSELQAGNTDPKPNLSTPLLPNTSNGGSVASTAIPVVAREVREIVVQLPNGAKRVYSEKIQGKNWSILAKQYAEHNNGKFIS